MWDWRTLRRANYWWAGEEIRPRAPRKSAAVFVFVPLSCQVVQGKSGWRESLIIGCLSCKSNNFKCLKGQVVRVTWKFLFHLDNLSSSRFSALQLFNKGFKTGHKILPPEGCSGDLLSNMFCLFYTLCDYSWQGTLTQLDSGGFYWGFYFCTFLALNSTETLLYNFECMVIRTFLYLKWWWSVFRQFQVSSVIWDWASGPSWAESFQGRGALEDLCPCLCACTRDLIFKPSLEKHIGVKEEAWRGGGGVLFLRKRSKVR